MNVTKTQRALRAKADQKAADIESAQGNAAKI